MTRRRRAASLTLAAALCAAAPAAPAGAGESADLRCAGDARPETPVTSDTASAVLDQLRIPDAHEVTRGRGVAVAVVDSGVASTGRYTLEPGFTTPGVGAGAPIDGHGTIVAALVAGADRPGGLGVGVAPGAAVVPVRVLDTDAPDEGERAATPASVAAGLDWVARHAEDRGIRVAVAPLRVGGSPVLAAAVERLIAADVVLLAASGKQEEDQEEDQEAEEIVPAGEDAAAYPADYPGVVGVSALAPTGADPGQLVPPHTAIDVAAPTLGAVSVLIDGSDCVVDDVATSWAAAEVAGVAALLRSAYPDDTVPQTVARLVETAAGMRDARNPFTGAGVVQPVEALRRDLPLARDGSMTHLTAADDLGGAAAEPPERPDLLARSREQFVWWSVVGGTLLGLALLLGPLVRRRRA